MRLVSDAPVSDFQEEGGLMNMSCTSTLVCVRPDEQLSRHEHILQALGLTSFSAFPQKSIFGEAKGIYLFICTLFFILMTR